MDTALVWSSDPSAELLSVATQEDYFISQMLHEFITAAAADNKGVVLLTKPTAAAAGAGAGGGKAAAGAGAGAAEAPAAAGAVS